MNKYGMEIRPLTTSDFFNGFLESLTALKPTDLTPREAVEIFYERSESHKTFVAVYNPGDLGYNPTQNVVGTATLLVEQKFIHHGGRVGHVEDVAVNQQFQGQGVGAALIKRLIEEAAALGCYKLILDCDENVVPFYEKLGLRTWATGMRVNLL